MYQSSSRHRCFEIKLESCNEFKYDEKKFVKILYHYNETFLSSYILNLKIDMHIMLLRNIRSFVMCNDIKARITRIDESYIKVEIISSKFKNTFILISRIFLNFKDDDVNKERKKRMLCQFTKRQHFIRSTFVMTINKSKRQFLRYVDIDVQTRECFTHEQFYVIDIKVTKKCNFYIITFE